MHFKKITILLFLLLTSIFIYSDEHVTGYWNMIDNNGDVLSVCAFYEYKEDIYGRLILYYDKETGKVEDTILSPKARSEKITGDPYISGMDFMWGFTKGEKYNYTDGYMIDPETGKSYKCDMTLEDDKLVLNIKFLFMKIKQTWTRANNIPKDIQNLKIDDFQPVIPQKK